MTRPTQDDLARILEQPGYTIGHCAHTPVVEWLPHTLTQHNVGSEPLASDEAEAAGRASIGLRITRFGTKLLDPDNLAGGCKPIIDALRYQKVIPEDDPSAIELIVKQRKVSKKETGTLIEIYPIT